MLCLVGGFCLFVSFYGWVFYRLYLLMFLVFWFFGVVDCCV